MDNKMKWNLDYSVGDLRIMSDKNYTIMRRDDFDVETGCNDRYYLWSPLNSIEPIHWEDCCLVLMEYAEYDYSTKKVESI